MGRDDKRLKFVTGRNWRRAALEARPERARHPQLQLTRAVRIPEGRRRRKLNELDEGEDSTRRRSSAQSKMAPARPAREGAPMGKFIKIIWALLLAAQLQLLLGGPRDNHLKCLCLRDELSLSPASQLLSAAGRDTDTSTNKQVIGDNGSGPQRPDGWPNERQSSWPEPLELLAGDGGQLANDLRAGARPQVGRRSNATDSIIDNQREPSGGGGGGALDGTRETNPLIEQATPAVQHERHRHQHSAAGHYGADPLEPPPSEASFLFHRPAHEGRTSASDCKRHCNDHDDDQDDRDDQAGRREQQFCASDGRLYGSLCAMRRRACELNVNLHRMRSLAHCQRLKWPLESSDNFPDLPPAPMEMERERAKPVAVCKRHNYEEFKAALWLEFNGNTELMFSYLDADGDQLIGARELWPRRQLETAPTGAWCSDANNLSCASPKPADEFIFEPHYHWSACSLSHLMLYELRHEGEKFDRNSFGRAFEETALASRQRTINQRTDGGELANEVRSTRQTDTTNVHLKLGESRRLRCLSKRLEVDLREARASSGGDDGAGASLSCSWWRHGANLATVRDQHVQLEAIGDGTRDQANRMLHLKDAQLYLSGQFECACHLGERQSFLHRYQVQVTGESRLINSLSGASFGNDARRMTQHCNRIRVFLSQLKAKISLKQLLLRHRNNSPAARFGEAAVSVVAAQLAHLV